MTQKDYLPVSTFVSNIDLLPFLVLIVCIWGATRVLNHLRNPLFRLPGPRAPNILLGFARELWASDQTELHERWVQVYGRTMAYRALWYTCFFTLDTKALAHILSRDDVYQKPYRVRTALARFVGMGTFPLLVMPALGSLHLKTFHEMFLDQALHLKDYLCSLIPADSESTTTDMYAWIHKVSLDIIGEAAFGCKVGAVDAKAEGDHELCDALRLVSSSVTRLSLWPLLHFFVPVLRIFPEAQSQRLMHARKRMSSFARRLIARKRDEMRECIPRDGTDPELQNQPRRRGNFLSLVVDANASAYTAYRLSDEAMVDGAHARDASIVKTTFLVAGHETTSAALSWLFYELGRRPDIRERLRDEFATLGTERPTIAQLASLPYLDCVIRESIRLYPAIPTSIRVAEKDDWVSLATPIPSGGGVNDRVFIRKGTPILIPILAINRDKTLWGDDAHEFRPERWDALPDSVRDIPSIWGHSMTFMAGPHACLGYRFAIHEMKVIVYTLLRTLDFELAVPEEDIGRSATVITRPMRKSDPDAGPQLPVIIRPCAIPYLDRMWRCTFVVESSNATDEFMYFYATAGYREA
ncbi:cytochrome P450 [Trametes polyzona]|nr:cytochrome P450 [Trametes polyzona]